jgi:hypothetical protein
MIKKSVIKIIVYWFLNDKTGQVSYQLSADSQRPKADSRKPIADSRQLKADS